MGERGLPVHHIVAHEAEMATATGPLDGGARLVTVTGPPGLPTDHRRGGHP